MKFWLSCNLHALLLAENSHFLFLLWKYLEKAWNTLKITKEKLFPFL